MMKIDNIWYLYETPDFNDAITGGLYSQYTLRENAILKELENNISIHSNIIEIF